MAQFENTSSFNTYNPSSSNNSPFQATQTPHHIQYNNPNNTQLINPFNNPPSSGSESDVRWIWRKQLEQRRRNIRNAKFYNNYIGTSKNKNGYLKHLVKIGCPFHELSQILKHCGYNVSASICTHKSRSCCIKNLNNNNRTLLGTISMNDLGLTFRRNAFSKIPLHIKYSNCNSNYKFETDIYIERIANTNFNKSFRPGTYGKFHSLKKGSWKEGKIFYVFNNDELVMNICNGIYIVFEMKTTRNKNDIIDGFKNIVGGVGLMRPSQSTKIESCLVFKKDPNFPMECLENSMIKIYALNGVNTDGSKLIIGDKIFDFSNQNVVNNDYEINMASIYSNSSLNSTVSNDTFSLKNNYDCFSSNVSANNNVNGFVYTNEYNNDIEMNLKRNEFEQKCVSLEHENNLINAKNCRLQTLNSQLMDSNSNLIMEKDREYQLHVQQIQQLQYQLDEQYKRINQLNEQLNHQNAYNNNNNNNNQIMQSPMDECMDSIHTSQMFPLNDNLEETNYFPNINDNYSCIQDSF